MRPRPAKGALERGLQYGTGAYPKWVGALVRKLRGKDVRAVEESGPTLEVGDKYTPWECQETIMRINGDFEGLDE